MRNHISECPDRNRLAEESRLMGNYLGLITTFS
jgi:hypothetical protein